MNRPFLNQKKNARLPRSLTATLAIAFFGLSALALLIFSSLQILLNIPTQQAAISNQEQLIAQGAANTVSSFIEEKFAILSTSVALANPDDISPAEQTQILTGLLAHDPALNQLVIFDTQNHESAVASRIQTNSTAALSKFISRVTGDVLGQAQKKQRYISTIYFDEVNGAPLVIMAVPAFDILGNFHGTLVAELNLISMWSLINDLKVGQTGYAYVVDKQGTLIAFKDSDRVFKGENESSYKIVDDFMRNTTAVNATKVSSYPGIKGTKVVGTYAAVGTPDWAVVIELPWTEAYQDVIRVVEVSVGIILVMTVLAALTGVYIARRLAAPLVKLTSTASRIAGGERLLEAEIGGALEIASLGIAFNSMTSQLRDMIGTLEERVAARTTELQVANEVNVRRAKQFESVALIARTISATQTLSELLPQITTTISEEFGFYHVGIFLVDARKEYAILAAANSEGGKKMLNRNHRLLVGGAGIVGFVTNTGQPRVSLDVGQDAAFFTNSDLPETHSEMALPLRLGSEVIGALDVQSTESDAFSPEDIDILSIMAGQVSIAIQNARSYQQSNEALAQAEAATTQLSGQQWKQYFKSQSSEGYIFDGINTKALVETDKQRAHSLAIPLMLRGTRIGTLKLSASDAAHTWTEDEIAMARAAAERTSVAVESARLLEEAQKRASKERAIGGIAAKISSLVNIENILQTAIQELGNTIPNTDIAIQFKKDQETE